MRKNQKRIKIAATISLALALLVGATGCGGGSNNQSGGGQGGAGQATNAPTADFVYVPEYTAIDGSFSSSLGGSAISGDTIYSVSSEIVADNTPEGVTPDYEGQYAVYGPVIYKISLDGKSEKVNYAAPTIPDGANGNVSINGICVSPDGTMRVMLSIYTYSVDAPEGVTQDSDEYWNYYTSEESYFIKTIAPDGTEMNSVELSHLNGDEPFYPNGFMVDNDENIAILSDAVVYMTDSTGTLLFTVEAENWMENIIRLSDGRLACLNYAGSSYQLSVIDMEAKAFGENIALPTNVYSVMPGGGDYDFYYTNGQNLYGYSVADGKETKLFNWLDCDINNDNIGTVNVLDDGRVVCIDSRWNEDYSETENEIVLLTKQPASSVPQKTHITLATQSLNYFVRDRIIEFNKSNDQYRIDVKDYSEYNTDDDYTAGLTKMTTEIMAGNVPDIIDMNGITVEQMAAKGLLEDLYPYIDSDSEFSREDFFPSVLTSLEIEGKLYTTCSGFSVSTVMGAARVVGDKPGWTVSDFQKALASMPDGCTAFDQYMTKDDIIAYCMALDMDSYVNWETGACSFDSEGFVNMLKFVNSFPSEFDWENYEWSEGDDSATRISNGQQMLLSTDIYTWSDFQMYKAKFGGNVTCVGFPTDYGTGNMISTGGGYAISSKSEYKDAAWNFLRTFFTEKYQSGDNVYNFPVNINAYNAKLKKAMTPEYQKDADGNFILDETGNKIEVSNGGWGWGSISIEIHAVTQEEADQVMDLINTTTKSAKSDSSITDIVKEQAAPYFEGQKSAEEVAKLVQSKANIYVNEQR